MKNNRPKILIAPLNWGLGHATRCIPIIEALLEEGFEPLVASDGIALQILQKEFPSLQFMELPSYQIEYATKGASFKWKMIKNSPKMMEAIYLERKMIKKWVKEHQLSGLISDNRLGVFSKKIPSVFITHQLNVLTGNTSWITSKLHQFIIKKYDECWVPDYEGLPNLSGNLGHLDYPHFKINYIGPLSRFTKKDIPLKYDLMVILSGPEPQRTLLEKHLTEELKRFKGQAVFIKGIVENSQKIEQIGSIRIVNFMTTSELEQTFNESKMVLSRSGYTTVMDVAKLGKKAFFIPTPGQFEQEYLAKKYKHEGMVPMAKQDKFVIEKLNEVDLYTGLPSFKETLNWKKLFLLFERE